MIEIDNGILGGGILGRCIASELQYTGDTSTVFSLKELEGSGIMRTLSCLATLQSGMMTPNDRLLGKLLTMHREHLVNTWGKEEDLLRRGVMMVPEGLTADDFVKQIKRSTLKTPPILTPTEISTLRIPRYDRERQYIGIEDVPIDLGHILRNINLTLSEEFVTNVPLDSGVVIQEAPNTHTGYSIIADGLKYNPKRIFVAAGIGTSDVLRHAYPEFDRHIKITRIPMLSAADTGALRTDLYLDTANRVLFTRHLISAEGNIAYRMAVSDIQGTEVESNFDWNNQVSIAEMNRLKEHLSFLDPNYKESQIGFNVCYKIDNIINGKLTRSPQTFALPNHPKVIVGIPGLMTLSLFTANKMIAMTDGEITNENPAIENTEGGDVSLDLPSQMWYDKY